MENNSVWLCIAIMAGVTYAIRVLPLVILKREIRQKNVRAFLYYVPYATLTAMTIPSAILDAPTLLAGSIGMIIAVLLAFWRISLVLVAAIASLTVWLVDVLV